MNKMNSCCCYKIGRGELGEKNGANQIWRGARRSFLTNQNGLDHKIVPRLPLSLDCDSFVREWCESRVRVFDFLAPPMDGWLDNGLNQSSVC